MKKGQEKIDLLALPVSERLRMCKEIHAALARRAEDAKLIVNDDALVMDSSVVDDSKWALKGVKEDSVSASSGQKTSNLNSLLKRIW